MQQAFVITFIADDKPGILETLSTTIAEAGGNWLQSKVTTLAGKFTGIVHVDIAENNSQALLNACEALNSKSMSVTAESLDQETAQNEQTLTLQFLGLDRPGIVKEFAQALAQQSLNIIKMHSVIESAPMSAEPLFKAKVDISRPDNLNIDNLSEELESIAIKLDLEWSLN